MATNTTSKRLLAGGLALVLTTGIGLSVSPAGAQDTSSSSSISSSTTTVDTPTKGPAKGARRDSKKRHHRIGRVLREHRRAIATSLAKALDIPVDQLTAAVRKVRSERPEGGFESPEARRTWVQEHLAKELSVSVEQLKAAEKAALEARLDAAVAEGTMSAERAQRIRERLADRFGNG